MIDHALGKKWHPNHAMRPPSTNTPRKGPKIRKEVLPPGWHKVERGPGLNGFSSEDRPYYFHEDTGETSWTSPCPERQAVKTGDNITLNAQVASNPQQNVEEESTHIECKRNEPDKKSDDFSIAFQEDFEEQHRNYFREALSAAKRGSTILEELDSPHQYKGDAAIAFVYFAAANVADSEGNEATGLAISGTDLINLAVDHIGAARNFAVKAGLMWTLDHAELLRKSAEICFYRKKDGDVSDGAEYLNKAQCIFASLGFSLSDWHVLETKERQDALVFFDGYDDYCS